MSGGKGGSTNSSGNSYSTGVSTTILPDWVTSASQSALSMGEGIANTPYTPYLGDLVASAPSDTLQAYQQIRDMQGMTNPAFDTANSIYGGLTSGAQLLTPEQQTGLTNQLYGNYGQQVIDPAYQYLSGAYNNAQNLYGQALGQGYGLLGGYLQGGPATAQQVGQNAATLMSPYTGLVINPALRLGQQALAQNLQQIGAGANQAGAFGGSRQGVQEGVAQSQDALQSEQYLGNLLNSQWNASLTPATQLALQAGQQGYGAAGALTNLGFNAAQNLGQFGQSAASALTNMLEGGYGQAQSGAQNLMSTNLQSGLTATGNLVSDALSQAREAQTETGLLQSAGTAQQQQAQNELAAHYAQFEDAATYPYQQLSTLLGTLDSIPYGSQTQSSGYNMSNSQSSTTPSWGSQVSSGLGTAFKVADLIGGLLGA